MTISDIKEIIKNRREELGLTIKQVADIVGVSEGTVSRWESGNIKNMKRDKIAALAKALQIQPRILMGWDEDESDVNKIGGYTIVYPGGEFCTTPGADHIDWVLHNGTEHYYIDPETAMLAQELKDNPQYRALLDSSKKLKPEGVKEVMNFINYQLQKEKGELDE